MAGYFGFDEDPMNYPGGRTARAAYDAYVAGQGPAWGPRPDDDLTKEINAWSRYGTPETPGFFARLFGGRQRGPTIDQEIADWSRYAASQPQPTDRGAWPQEAKPATKITSAPDIARRISAMIGTPQMPPQVDPAAMGGDPASRISAMVGMPQEPPMPRVPVDMRTQQASAPPPPRAYRPQDYPAYGGSFWDRYAGSASAPNPSAYRAEDYPQRAPDGPYNPAAYPDVSWSAFWDRLLGRERKAHGGYMRGGYPEMIGMPEPAPTMPMRPGYFSTGGGQNYVQPDGQGDGRSDHIEARLSPGEYVLDGDTVALLGDGNGEAGARKMDAFRESVRKHKGKALAKGKFAPAAKKDATEYLASSPISDGLRRRARKED